MIGTLPERALQVQTIRRFRGLNRWESVALVKPDQAIDLMNVIPSSSGALEKIRLPVILSPDVGEASGPRRFMQYQQGTGLRQVVAQFGQRLYKFDGDSFASPLLIEDHAQNSAPYDFLWARNLLYLANGTVMRKWNGTALQAWGIQVPSAAPVLGVDFTVAGPLAPGLSRTANVVTVILTGAFTPGLAVGDPFILTGATNPSFNGSFTVASINPPGANFTYAQTGANESSGNGITHFNSFPDQVGASASSRTAGVVTLAGVGSLQGFADGDRIVVTGASDATFNGTFDIFGVTSTSLSYRVAGSDVSGVTGSTVVSSHSPATGVSYRYAYKNSVTGHVGAASSASVRTAAGTNRTFFVSGTASPDAQVDTIIWYRTLDGGGDYFFHSEFLLSGSAPAPGLSTLFLRDRKVDAGLTLSIQAPLLNFPPIAAKYLAKYGERIYGFNLTDGKSDIEYSAFEQVLTGRPEESFFPNNRLRLPIGADELAGGGVIQAGVIAFSRTNQMFMHRGIPEDITLTTPVRFSAVLEELPFGIGLASHFSIQSTPYGLVWLGADLDLFLYGGVGAPQSIAGDVRPLLRAITAGTQDKIESAYFNYADREWYVLSIAVNGALEHNRLVIVDMTPSAEENLGIFVSDIAADGLGIVELTTGEQLLCLGQGGRIRKFKAISDTEGGITLAPTSTAGVLGAWWRGGYFGNKEPELVEMNRWCRLVADQGGFSLVAYLVDDEFRNPEILNKGLIQTGKGISINKKSKRVSYEIRFPNQDVSANVVEFQHSSIPCGER